MAGIKRGPWTIHQSKTIYDNPWMKIEEFDVTRPDGSVGIYGVMEPKNFAIGVLPLFANGDTILVGQYRFAVDAHSWELPEGGGPRAFSLYSGSYPQAVKSLAHSVGVMASSASATALCRSGTVRAAALRSRALSLEKAFSMGLKSGL